MPRVDYNDLNDDVDFHGRPVKSHHSPKSFDDGPTNKGRFKGKNKTRARRARRGAKEAFLNEG